MAKTMMQQIVAMVVEKVAALRVRPPLTGDPAADYYSGAIKAHALDHWQGYMCEIFLMPEKRIVVVTDESTHHRFWPCSVEEVLAGRTYGIHFDDSQLDERESFERRIRNEGGNSPSSGLGD